MFKFLFGFLFGTLAISTAYVAIAKERYETDEDFEAAVNDYMHSIAVR